MAIISTFHHMRTYRQRNDDWLRVADVSLSCIFTLVVTVSASSALLILPLLSSVVLAVVLNVVGDCTHKSLIHMSIHLLAISSVMFLLFQHSI